MAEKHTRESLLDAWQAIGATEPLCHEMQNLCLMYINQKPTDRKKPLVKTQSCRDTAAGATTSMPPPQRLKRVVSKKAVSNDQQPDNFSSRCQRQTSITQGDEASKASNQPAHPTKDIATVAIG